MSGPRIVVIGGGSGSSVLLSGLKRHTSDITAIVSMFDSGGSTGILREEFGYPPFGDIRQCLMALAANDEIGTSIRTVFDFRFSSTSSLKGHNVGNLVLAALTTAHSRGIVGAIEELSQMLNVAGKVVPVTLEDAHLCAELEDGSEVVTESAIDLRGEGSPIKRVHLDRQAAANPDALKAIAEADAVVLGPGDLYTSVVPNLLAEGMSEALRNTPAQITYVCNVMTKLGETSGYDAVDFARTVYEYLDGRKLDYAVVNTQSIPGDVLARYRAEDATPVSPGGSRILEYARSVVHEPLINLGPPVRHDPAKLASLVWQLAVSRTRMAEYSPSPVASGD